MLRQIRVKNINKVMIGTLNINSLANKFDQLREIRILKANDNVLYLVYVFQN